MNKNPQEHQIFFSGCIQNFSGYSFGCIGLFQRFFVTVKKSTHFFISVNFYLKTHNPITGIAMFVMLFFLGIESPGLEESLYESICAPTSQLVGPFRVSTY